MKIVFASYVYSPEFNKPAEWLSRIKGYIGILEWLSKKHTVISIEQINYEGNYQLNGVAYHFMHFGKKRSYFPWRQHRYIKALQPDVVLIHGLHFPLQVIQLRLRLGRQVKIIAQHHAEKQGAGFRKYLQRAASRCINAYLFTSRAMGMEWVRTRNIPDESKIREVMEASSVFFPMDHAQARSVTGVQGAVIFLWVGRLDDNKDPLTVVRAFLQFTRHYPDAKLYMIYHTDPLQAAIESLLKSDEPYKDKVVLVGRVPHEQMLYWFNSADFIISGSHYEGSGVAVCEAMSCGCIPVVTSILAFQQLTANGRCGLLYAPGNAAALLSVLLEAMTLNREDARNKTLAQFDAQLSFKAISTRIQEVIASL
jgi:glycosyltransferase involved in cell wall biosynthesis